MTDFVSGKAVCIGTKPKQLLLEKGMSKTLRIMKLTAILLFAAAMHVSAKGVGQDKISLSLKNTPLEKVFGEIEAQSGFVFIYKDETVKDKRISIQVSNVTLSQALDECLKGQALSYQIVGKSVAIKAIRKNTDQIGGDPTGTPPFIDVRGRVVNEKGEPVEGVTVTVKGHSKKTLTDKNGEFSMTTVEQDATLVFTHITMESFEVKVSGKTELVINLRTKVSALGDVVVTVSTGYQQLPKERATGSFVHINNELLNRAVGTNVLDRLKGITSGLLNSNTLLRPDDVDRMPSVANRGLNIRGTSTISPNQVNTNPLIVLDNFPYEGDIRNINPNDIESVSILKDAAAASIWGAKSGNGVIVITTKRGKLNQKLRIQFNSNVTVVNKPDLFYDKNFLNSSDYIDVETYLFNQGYFTSDLSNTTNRPGVSPVVEILNRQKSGQISTAEANSQLDALREVDVRNDYDNHVYQKSVNQQYSIGLRGGSNNLLYSLSAGYDKNKNSLVGNGYERIVITSASTYIPVQNLEVSAYINYSQSKTTQNNQFGYGSEFIGGKYGNIFPYARLADDAGSPLSVLKDYRGAYIDSAQKLGFKDWSYKPLNEMKYGDNNSKINSILLRASVKYKIRPYLSAEIQYQNERQMIASRDYRSVQTYYARNLINRFSIYNPTTKSFTYNLPVGGMLNLGNYDWVANSLRGQLNYSQSFGIHTINAIGGMEIRQLKATGFNRQSYGYNDDLGTAAMNLNFNTSYNTNPSGSSTLSSALPTLNGNTTETLNRFVSYYLNAGYSYNERYDVTVSARKDGANLFGVKTNDKITPLWSAGLGWSISKEKFYTFDLIPYLKLRATYGFNGNVYNGSAYVTGNYFNSSLTGAQTIYNIVPGNDQLKWEKIKNINIGLDFSLKKDIIQGTIELYKKEGIDLLETTNAPPQTGFVSVLMNTAKTKTTGVDLTLTSTNINRAFSWKTVLLLSTIKDKLVAYTLPQTSATIQKQATFTDMLNLVGKPLFGIYSYKWAGLDPTNGDPQGYLNGKISKDYTGIVNNFNPDSLVYNGVGRPTVFGSLRNDFFYKGFSLSVNVTFKLGYYFRRPTISLNYQDMLTAYTNDDYSKRWMQPGDEEITNVPSLMYPSNSTRNTFYQYSEILVEKADHIRLQDIRFAYNFNDSKFKKGIVRGIEVYSYLNNLGFLWRANKNNIDPDVINTGSTTHFLPSPFAISFGVQVNL